MDNSPITGEHIAEFVNSGVVVIPNVVESGLIDDTLRQLRHYLSSTGCDPNDLANTAGSLSNLSSTNGSGGILDIFYEDWKLRLNENPVIVSILQELWRHTYAQYSPGYGGSDFQHPYGNFDPNEGYMYIDRVCFRVPDDISAKFGPTKKKQLQRSLTPHLDCCPHDMYGKDSKWRPIQAFLCLTDTLLPDQGGFEACPGHHKGFAQWASTRTPSVSKSGEEFVPCVGDFTPIRPIEDKDVLEKFCHIPCKAGDLVCWDYRIPHANARHNLAPHPRAVVYIGLLPAVPINERYAQRQLDKFRRGEVPSDQWHESTAPQPCNYAFSELGRKLMGMDPWI